MPHSHANLFLHQNQPSRESIFCGKVGDWWTKRALIMLNFLLKTRQKAIVPHTRVWAKVWKTFTPTTASASGCRACCSQPTEIASWKRRSHLPLTAIFTGRVLSYKSVYAHFRKWSRNGEWKKVWGMMLSRHRSFLDMSCVDLDGSHTTTLRGGECCGYQGRKKRTTTNVIYVTDRQGIPLTMSTPVSGSHNDLHCISEVLQGLFAGIKDSGLSVSGLFLNADASFDSAQFRRDCHQQEVFPNVAFNKRRGMRRDDELLDELLYKERYNIERTNAWMDSYRSVLNRFDTTQTSWEGWNYIAFILILLKKIRKREKSR